MSENTHQLKTRPQIARESIEEVLEDALQRVRDGEIVSLALAYVTLSGSIGTDVADSENVGPLIGAIALLQHRICAAE